MKPVDFPQSNSRFGAPLGYSSEQVEEIPAYVGEIGRGPLDGDKCIIVAWKPDEQELQDLIAGGAVYLCCLNGLPPHTLTTRIEFAQSQQKE